MSDEGTRLAHRVARGLLYARRARLVWETAKVGMEQRSWEVLCASNAELDAALGEYERFVFKGGKG